MALAKKPAFFTIQLIFATIHGSHCTFCYYSRVLLYYFNYLVALFIVFSTKKFQFQLNKRFPNRLVVPIVKIINNYMNELIFCDGDTSS